MEKITPLSLFTVGDIVLASIRRYISMCAKDPGLEIALNWNAFQQTFVLNFFDEITLFIKIFPHKNVVRESVFRLEVFMARCGDMRGRRIAVIEVPRSNDVVDDIQSFIEGILSRAGLKPT